MRIHNFLSDRNIVRGSLLQAKFGGTNARYGDWCENAAEDNFKVLVMHCLLVQLVLWLLVQTVGGSWFRWLVAQA